MALACKLDGTSLNGLNLRVAPRKEKPPEVTGEALLDLDMKKFRHEKHPRLLRDIDEFLQVKILASDWLTQNNYL